MLVLTSLTVCVREEQQAKRWMCCVSLQCGTGQPSPWAVCQPPPGNSQSIRRLVDLALLRPAGWESPEQRAETVY